MKKVNNIKFKLLLMAFFAVLALLPIKVDALGNADCGSQLKAWGHGDSTKFQIDGKYTWCINAGAKIKLPNGQLYYYNLTETSNDYFARFVYSAYKKYGSGIFDTWDVYLAIRSVARTGGCSGATCEDIKSGMTNNKCTVYAGKARYPSGSNCVERTDAQNMLAVDCTLQPEPETNPCENTTGCCTHDGHYYWNGQDVGQTVYNTHCQDPTNPCANTTGCCTNNGHYYWNGQDVGLDVYNTHCQDPNNPCLNTTSCCTYDGRYYYGGSEVGATAYASYCPCDQDGCCKTESPLRYYLNRVQISESTYSQACCEEFYDLCCVVNNKYYLDGVQVTDKKKCLSCKPKVSYHESCQLNDLEEMGEIPSYDGNTTGDLVKTKFENDESINFITYKELEDEDVIKCVLTKQTDYADNSLEAKKIISGNPYCKVFCKDDVGKFDEEGELRNEEFHYGYAVSGLQDANSGRYFRLNAEHTYKRTCYSTSNEDDSETKEINLDKFNADVKRAVDIINNNINKLNKAYAEYAFLRDNDPTPSTYDGTNSTHCTSDLTYTISSLDYNDTSGLQRPPTYKISLDEGSTTDHHYSFKVEKPGGTEATSVDTHWDDENSYPETYYYYACCGGEVWNSETNTSECPGGYGDYCGSGSVTCTYGDGTTQSKFQTYKSAKESEYLGYKSIIEAQLALIESYVTSINECTDWFSKFNKELFDPNPEVTYKYGYQDEDGNNDFAYYDNIPEESKKMHREENTVSQIPDQTWTAKTTEYDKSTGAVSVVIPTSPQKLPCVDDKYNEERGISCTDNDGDSDSVVYLQGLSDMSYYFDVPIKNMSFLNYTYMKKSIERSYSFTSPNEFSTLYPSGVVVLRDDENFAEDKVDFDGLPVQIETKTGTHKFTFTFSDIGEYFDSEDTEMGRIFDSDYNGNPQTVLGKYNEEEMQIFTDTNGEREYNYVCYYRVNCPNCEPECEGEECTLIIPDCPGGHCCPYCNPECVDCIYTKKEYELDFTPIPSNRTGLPSNPSPSNPNPTFDLITVINPNGNDYVPYNWNIWTTYEDYGDRYDIINDKAQITIDEIQTYGELVYVSHELGNDDVFEGNPAIEGISSPVDFGVLKVVMTPALAQDIRDYNKRAENETGSGGFTNNTLTCYDYTYNYETGTAKFEKIFCYSSFLDNYVGNPNFTFYSGRLDNDNDRKNSNGQNGYWQTFLSQPDCNGQNCGSYAGTIVEIQHGDMEKIGGPSWR